ncbi:MAG: cupredoxin domain-containing protein [Nitrososphaeraceae archaeon]|nr:cupredoxin domain-containing protein [Nitrososphaeraceae archaeon]
MTSLIVSSIFSALPTEVFANQIPSIHTVGNVFDTSNATSAASINKSIVLNAAEVSEDETAEEGEDEKAEEGEDETAEEGEDEKAEGSADEMYRWVDSTGAENPDLSINSNTEYTIKIDNPTDEEHELIIDSEPAGNTSAIAESGDIEPGKNVEFKFKAEQVGELGYHCKYHPEMMNGTINVS